MITPDESEKAETRNTSVFSIILYYDMCSTTNSVHYCFAA